MLMVSELVGVARGTSSPDELARRSPARFDRAGAPVVVWNVCQHCNMTCPHCYAAARPRPAASDLDTAQGRRLLDVLAEGGVRVVIFSGGEPLLRPDLLDLVAHARGLGMTPQLSTNGWLIDRPLAERLAAAGVAYVGVSLDGLPRFNDEYRGLRGGFRRAVRALRVSRRAGLRTGLRVTLTRRNLDALPPLLDLAVRLEVGRFYVSHLVYAGRARRLVREDLSPEESRQALLRLFAAAERLLDEGRGPSLVCGGNDSGGALLALWVAERHGAEAAARVREVLARRGGNSAGERILCVDARGRVHPDQFWRGAVLGDLGQDDLAGVLGHPLVGELRARTSRLTGRCAACPHLALCRGSHRERALAVHGDLWAPDPACVLSDEETRPGGLA